jgi:hypothetical protein
VARTLIRRTLPSAPKADIPRPILIGRSIIKITPAVAGRKPVPDSARRAGHCKSADKYGNSGGGRLRCERERSRFAKQQTGLHLINERQALAAEPRDR